MPRQRSKTDVATYLHESRADILRAAIFASVLLLCYGCVNLTGVREFSKTSAETATYQGITQDFIMTLERREAFKPPGAQPSSRILEERKALKKKLDAAQQVIVNYMKALEALSSNDLVVYNKELDTLAKAMSDAKIAPEKDINAYKAAANLIARISTDLYRQGKLKQIIPSINPSIQMAIDTIKEVIKGDYILSISNEEDQIESFFSQIYASAKQKDVVGLSMLAKLSYVKLHNQVQTRKEAAHKYVAILDKISEGHKHLTDHISDISSGEMQTQLLSYQKDIQDLYKTMKGAWL